MYTFPMSESETTPHLGLPRTLLIENEVLKDEDEDEHEDEDEDKEEDEEEDTFCGGKAIALRLEPLKPGLPEYEKALGT